LEPKKLTIGQISVLSSSHERLKVDVKHVQAPLSHRKVEIQKIEGIKEEEDEQLVSARNTTKIPESTPVPMEGNSPTLSLKRKSLVGVSPPNTLPKNEAKPVWDEDLLKQP
jgi:hypothetical protein